MLFIDDGEITTGIKPIYVDISFPLTAEYENESQASSLYRSGVDFYRKGKYLDKVKASKKFVASLENKFFNNPALEKLVLTYAEIYPNTFNKEKANTTLYGLIQFGKSKLYSTHDMALGTATYYMHLKKYRAAIDIIENFLRHGQGFQEKLSLLKENIEKGKFSNIILKDLTAKLADEFIEEDQVKQLKGKISLIKQKRREYKKLKKSYSVSRPTLKMMGVYLELYLSVSEFSKAREVFEKLKNEENMPLETYIAIARFLRFDERYDLGKQYLIQASKKYSNFALVWIEFSEYILKEGDSKKFKQLIDGIEVLKAENSPIYYGKYLEYLGIYNAMMGQNEEAAKNFKKALKINESNELISKLASLELGGSKSVESLIIESKIIKLIKKSKEMEKDYNWDKAFSYAIEAVDLNREYIPSKLQLSSIQIKRGYFRESIDTLQSIFEKHPTNKDVIYSLINAYIKAHNFDEAIKFIQIAGGTKLLMTDMHETTMAKYHKATGNILMAIKSYEISLGRNPVNDDNYYQLSKIFLKLRQYKRCKDQVLKALSLDPENVNYLSLYSKVLYELDGVDVAIGYIRKILKKHPKDPKLLSDIAIYYYKSGKQKEFLYYKKIVESLPLADIDFFDFLISTSKLEDNPKDVIKYSKALLKLLPGELEIRLRLGETYLEIGEVDHARKMFLSIIDRLDTFPSANYFLSLISLKRKNLGKAHQYADEEIKINPNKEIGYYAKGQTFKAEKKYTDSIRLLEKAISINGNNVDVLLSLGDLKYRQNYYEEAREYFLRSYKLDEGNPEISKKLGYVYKDIGQAALAIEYFKAYLSLYPNAPDKGVIDRTINALKF